MEIVPWLERRRDKLELSLRKGRKGHLNQIAQSGYRVKTRLDMSRLQFRILIQIPQKIKADGLKGNLREWWREMGQFGKYLGVRTSGMLQFTRWGGSRRAVVNAPPVRFWTPLPFSCCVFTSNSQHLQGEPEVPGIYIALGRALANDSWCRSETTPASLPWSRLLWGVTVSRSLMEWSLNCSPGDLFVIEYLICFLLFPVSLHFPLLFFPLWHFLVNQFHMNPHLSVCFWGVCPTTAW